MSDSFVVGDNANVDGIRVLVAGDGATLSGRVLSGPDTPVSDARFVLVPSDQRKWRARATYLFGVSANDGNYSLSGAPGDYLIIFLREGDQSNLINESWIRAHSTTADHVALLPRENKHMDLTIAAP